MNKTNRRTDFETDLIEQLRDKEFAVHYLNELLADHSEGCKERLLVGLRRIAQARGIKQITENIGRSPKALYVSLSPKGNPTLSMFLSVLEALGISLKANVTEHRGRRRTAHA